ncbi:MAG: peptide chain release factor N(5)-glutamine methyltransferase [Alphaproteobacteria bacterium]|nr:peptide chain release factor N(5)-glutamine methyltransferase [Alphaproteobacteria bacterium]
MQPSVYQTTIEILAEHGIESPRLEARLLIADALGIDVNQMPLTPSGDDNTQTTLERNIQRRLDGMPIDKILGHREFYKYDFVVTKDVLSPRPDTEILVESALKIIKSNSIRRVLDLGVGSGCILLSLLAEDDGLTGVGIDASKEALAVAKKNAKNLKVTNRVELLQKNWFDNGFIGVFDGPFDMIVTNPPYIKTADIEKLDISVKKYDPLLALDGGEDGFKDYRKIAEFAPFLLENSGYLLLEIGRGQGRHVKTIYTNAGLNHIGTIKDLAGIERVLIFQK